MNKTLITHALVILLSVIFSQQAASLQPTQAQIEQFKRMSPAEQKALAQSMGIEIPNLSSGSTQTTQIGTPETPRPRDTDSIQKDQEKEIEKNNLQASKTDQEKLEGEQEDRSETKPLKQFGYELFAGDPSTFAPVDNIPVPFNYVIGPGDTVIIQLYGKENGVHEITISREGILQFPDIGPISVNGLNFKELKQQIQDVVQQQMIGVKASVTMGSLRSIQIFVLGEAFRPGAYTVSSLSTMTNALFVSGGITKVGSLRNVQLKRDGKIVSQLDLYDLLLKGDTSKDARLLPGDVLFIPPIGKTAGISGEVRRPAIYEFKGNATADDLVNLAGGYLPTAYPSASRIERILDQGTRTFVDLDLSNASGKNKTIKDGDLVQVYSILDKMDNAVLITGHVNRPGGFQWKPGLRISDLLTSINDLLPDPDLNFALLKRETKPNRTITTLRVSLGKAIKNPKSNYDIQLQPRDELIVLSHSGDRREQIDKVIKTIINQQEIGEYPKIVSINGNVRYPGDYPLNQNMNVKDLILAAGGYLPESDSSQALLVNRSPKTSLLKVNRITPRDKADLETKLHPNSELIIFGLNQERESLLEELLQDLKSQASRNERQEIVTIGGSVKFPGEYPFTLNMTMQSLIEMAGGLKESAYMLQADITRQHINDKDEFYIEHSVVDNNSGGVLGENYPINIKDRVVVKRIPNWGEQKQIRLTGEVKFPGTYPIASGETLGDILKRSGGLTEFADPEAAIFLRETLKEKEAQLLKTIQARLEKDVATLEADAAVGTFGNDKLQQAQMVEAKLLDKINTVAPTGRLVINLPNILDGNERQDVALMDGDQLVIPSKIQEVSILGEVNFPTSHLYVKKGGVRKYINLSGGTTRYSDRARTYIVRKDGRVEPGFNKFLFFIRMQNNVNPGDSIIVPIDTDLTRPLDYWMGVSQILFQLATTAAALDSVGAL